MEPIDSDGTPVLVGGWAVLAMDTHAIFQGKKEKFVVQRATYAGILRSPDLNYEGQQKEMPESWKG